MPSGMSNWLSVSLSQYPGIVAGTTCQQPDADTRDPVYSLLLTHRLLGRANNRIFLLFELNACLKEIELQVITYHSDHVVCLAAA